MAYTKTTWNNNQPPAIDADNLNKIEQGIYDAHDEITDLKGDLTNFNGNIQLVWEQGGLALSTGAETVSSNAVRTKNIGVPAGRLLHIHNIDARKLSVFEYKTGGTLNRVSVYQRTNVDGYVKVYTDTAYIRILVEATEITPSYAENIILLDVTENHSILEDSNRQICTSLGVQILRLAYGYVKTDTSTADVNTVNASSNYQYAVSECKAGDLFVICGDGATGAKLWAFVDANGNRFRASRNDASTNGEYLPVIAPEDAKYFVFNTKVTATKREAYKLSNPVSDYFKTTFCAFDFIDGRYGTANGIYDASFAGTAICTQDYIDESVKAIIATNAVKICMLLYDKTDGDFVQSVYWIKPDNNSPYWLDHGTYLYKMYCDYDDEKTITDKSDLLSRIYLVCNGTEYAKHMDSIKAEYNGQKSTIKGLANAVQALKEHANYNIAYANAGQPLSLENYTGNTQNVHPKVLYFENGFGGYKYWMAYTPYPFSADGFENPCIAYSDDGINWIDFDGNPLDDPNGNGYNSDTHLVYRSDTGVLECWYRYVGALSQSPREETIYRQVTTDGKTWGTKELIYSNTSGTYSYLLSPAIIFEDDTYHIWVVRSDTANVVYYTAPANNPSNWTEVRRFTTQYYDGDTRVYPWHIDVIKDEGNYILLAMCRNGTELTAKCSLFITTSSDNITYSTPQKIIGGSANGWDKYMYRSSIVKIGNEYVIYYSAGKPNGTSSFYNKAVWGLGISKSETLNNFVGTMYS